jgi:hypothetical protein
VHWSIKRRLYYIISMCKRGPIQPDLGYEVRTTKETKNPTTTWKQHGWLPFFFVSRINGDTIQVRSDSDFCRKFSFFLVSWRMY